MHQEIMFLQRLKIFLYKNITDATFVISFGFYYDADTFSTVYPRDGFFLKQKSVHVLKYMS